MRRWSTALGLAGLLLSACGSASTSTAPSTQVLTSAPVVTPSIVVMPSIAMPPPAPAISAPAVPRLAGPAAPVAVALLVLDDPGAPAMTAASTASEIISAADGERWAQSRTFVREGSPHDDGGDPRVSFGVFAVPSDGPTPGADPRSRAVDVDGRSMTLTNDAENSIAVQATTIDGMPFAIGSLNVPEPELVELAAAVMWTGDRYSFTTGDAPPGWIDAGSTLAQMSFISGVSGSSTPHGGARVTYGDATPDGDAVALTTWAGSAPDPAVEARYSIDGEQEQSIDLRGDAATAYTGDGEFFSFVVWWDAGQWVALSSPSRTVDDLIALASSVRPATPAEAEAITAMAG